MSVVVPFFLSPPRLAFLEWGNFHARWRFVRLTIPEEKWGLLVVWEIDGTQLNRISFTKSLGALID